MIVLTIWNFTIVIWFGRPFSQGHTIDGLVYLRSGTVLNITVFAFGTLIRRARKLYDLKLETRN
jgi:hypothetical protein